MKKFHLFICSIFISLSYLGQKEFTIQECIDLAIKNSQNTIVQQNNIQLADLNRQFGKWSFLPTFSASPSYNINYGRKLDPFTNTFGTNKISSNLYGINSQVILFQGFKYFIQNNYFKLALKTSEVDKERILEKVKNQVIDKCYAIWKVQAKLSQQEKIIENLQLFNSRQIELVKEGRLSAIDTLETSINSKIQLVTLLNLKRELKYETTNLNYLLGLTLLNDTKLEKFNPQLEKIEVTVDEYYQLVDLQNKLELSQLQYKIDRTQLLPTFYLGGTIGTGYSTNNKDYNLESTPIIPFSSQINQNAYQGIGFSLSLPIFNKGELFKRQKQFKISQTEQLQLIEYKKIELEKKKLEINIQKRNLEENLAIQKAILQDKETFFKMNQLIYLEGKIRLSEVEKVEAEYYSYLKAVQDLELEVMKISSVSLD
jgi:outer membrane protein